MEKEELKKILENHLHWIKEDCKGWESMKADLRNADLSGADLSGADLSGADFRNAYLSGADFRNADLSGAYLSGADFRNAYLSGADFRNAYLSGADFSGADLREAKNVPFIPYACPDFGMFIGFKKAINPSDRSKCIVVLEIPEDARRLSGSGRKCRCDKAKVLEIQNLDASVPYDYNYAVSEYDNDFEYKVGEIVTPDQFCEDRWQECASGIHFFINRQEAVNYCL